MQSAMSLGDHWFCLTPPKSYTCIEGWEVGKEEEGREGRKRKGGEGERRGKVKGEREKITVKYNCTVVCQASTGPPIHMKVLAQGWEKRIKGPPMLSTCAMTFYNY